MNEILILPDGRYMVVGDAGSVSGILAELVEANTIPAVLDDDGNEVEAAIVPDADTLAVEISAEDLKTHEWRLPKARAERLEDIRGARNAKLKELDEEANQALTGRPGMRSLEAIEAHRQKLRDLPPIVEKILSKLNNTDDIDSCSPKELK